MEEVVIVAAARTPVGKFQGALSSFSATKLGAIAVREAVLRAGLHPRQVDECIMGNVLSAGLGQIRRVRQPCSAGYRMKCRP